MNIWDIIATEGKKYLKDAKPGGLLNSELDYQGLRKAGEVASMTPTPVGDVASGLLAVDDLRNKQYGSAVLNSIGLLPFVPGMAGTTVLHGSKKLFDKFEIQADRNPALFFTPVPWRSRIPQAKYYAGPGDGWMYEVNLAMGNKFDPLNDKNAKEIYENIFPGRQLKQWVEYPDIYIDSPLIKAMKEHGYDNVKVYEPSVQDFSIAVTNPELARIVSKRKVK